MKTGLIKYLLLAMVLLPPLAQAQMKFARPTFETGESEPVGVDASLQASPTINDQSSGEPAPATTGPAQPYAPTLSSVTTTTTEPASPPASAPAPASDPPPATAPATAPAAAPAPIPEAAPVPTTTVAATTIPPSPPPPEPMISAATQSAGDKAGIDSPAQWNIRNGERISEVFGRWSRVVGWQLTWEPTDLVALADLTLEDTYTGAIAKVVEAVNRNGAEIQAQFYTSNHMLRIMARK